MNPETKQRRETAKTRELSRIVGKKVYLSDYHRYAKILEDRGLTIEAVCREEPEVAFMRLWFTLNTK